MTSALELFGLGIALSFGPCLLHCSSIMLPYLASSKQDWKASLKSTLIFLCLRMIVYSVFGLAAGAIGRMISITLHGFQGTLFLFGGLFIVLLGLAIIFGYDPSHSICQAVRKRYDRLGNSPFIILALAVSIIPCASLLAVLAYIAIQAEGPIMGAAYGLAFGAGKLISPLIPLGAAAGYLSGKLSLGSGKRLPAVSLVCGIILVILGGRMAIFGW